MGSQPGLPFPSPIRKEPGETGPDPGKSALHGLSSPAGGPGSPPPPPAAQGRGRRSRRPRAWYPAQRAPQPRPPRPVRLTSARAGSGTCAAAGCGCSCWTGASGSLFRRSSSGTARTPAEAHSSGTSRSRSSRVAEVRPLSWVAAAAIPPAETAAAGGSAGYGQPQPQAASAAPALRPRRCRRSVKTRHHTGSGCGGRGALGRRERGFGEAGVLRRRLGFPVSRDGHTTPPTVSGRPSPASPGPRLCP